jgi:hypothetical protein
MTKILAFGAALPIGLFLFIYHSDEPSIDHHPLTGDAGYSLLSALSSNHVHGLLALALAPVRGLQPAHPVGHEHGVA